MKKKKIVKIIALLAVVLFSLASMPSPVRAASLDELLELEALIEQYKNEADKQAELADAVFKEMEILDTQATEIKKELDSLNEQIAGKELMLSQAQTDLEKAAADKQAYQNQLEERMTIMYMYGDKGYLEVLFGSTSFSDFIGRATAIASVISYDNEIAQKLKQTESLIEAKTLMIEEEKQELEKLKDGQLAKQAELQASIDAKQEVMDEMLSMEAYWEALAAQEEASASELRRELAEENANGNFANTFTTFLWPTPGYYYITSPYGYRVHPIYGTYTFHSGIDIGAPYNASAIAPANGVVTWASWNGGYGNCVIVYLGEDAYGNSYKVLYGHLDSYAVSEGDIVTRGQTVGYVGTTGASTGYHLHFEVIINGVTADPEDYLTW